MKKSLNSFSYLVLSRTEMKQIKGSGGGSCSTGPCTLVHWDDQRHAYVSTGGRCADTMSGISYTPGEIKVIPPGNHCYCNVGNGAGPVALKGGAASACGG